MLKINEIISLQDARYCAAVGFSRVEFSLQRGSTRKLPPKMIQDMIGWLTGPLPVLRLDAQSIEELDTIEVSELRLSVPFKDVEAVLLLDPVEIFVRLEADTPAAEVEQLLARQDLPELWLELHISAAALPEGYDKFTDRLLLHFDELALAQSYLSKHPSPVHLAFGAEADEEPGYLDYEQVDELLESFALGDSGW